VLRELESIAEDNGMRILAKTRLSDVIQKDGTYLSAREFDFYTRSHFDFVIADNDWHPLMVVEYDGPVHEEDEKQQERDRIKNEFCRRAKMGILRINDRYVTKLANGMTMLRWIVEVTELEKAFYEAQENGGVPMDEPFDPSFLITSTDGQKLNQPYWMSRSATQSFHAFFNTLDRGTPKGWSSVQGRDGDGNGFRLSCLFFGEQMLWVRTAIRKQGLNFSHYDLLDQLDTCELGARLEKFKEGRVQAGTRDQFRSVFERFCDKYNATPSHSMGAFPFETSWNFSDGWRCK
jgi:very-short-patch-repair endonuclease